MTPILEALAWAAIAFGFVAVLWALIRMLEPACYDPPKHTDTLFRGAKQCHNCMHSEISIVHPELACAVLGKHVEPHHSCKEWM